ncbi:uncharacterized protein LAESUDRAFT_407438 [Laetiporus sulphureus 93-53]|uniref:Protein YOP1 n=1 Tax=Laetiporus sulphureus 93-53 TaxID=1314785 RepID=A0A165C9A1_9APHY|nr:uncharacterized protein LAESUDRAFT_407438 [Laetiporus sulphureus 93-53]KZT02422.1 hypothetical protein LAESUDRAFT_407438 [Laetiporus sulphureus 93-53]
MAQCLPISGNRSSLMWHYLPDAQTGCARTRIPSFLYHVAGLQVSRSISSSCLCRYLHSGDMFTMISNLTCAWFAFMLPCYSTWKSLSHRPVSEPELERWMMYWSVMGAFVAFEYVVEWLVDWLPFYYEAKTVFLLFLSLPQTQGSTWVYTAFMHPFFTVKEADIDAGIDAAQSNLLTYSQERLTALVQYGLKLAGQARAEKEQSGVASSSALDMAKGLLSAFNPSVIQTAVATVDQRPAPSHASSTTSVNSMESTTSSDSSSTSDSL